jgi:hypothetical protein
VTWDALPPLLTVAMVATLYQTTPKAIRRRRERGSFPVVPYQRRPLLWARDDIRADIEGRRVPLRRVAA